MNAGDAAVAPLPWARRGVLLLLAAASIAPYPLATLTPDTARDIEAALAIVGGGRLPLQGGLIGGSLYLGPLWYYLLASGVALTHSVAGVSLFVGVLAALKFPLAYLTGKTLAGPAAGFWIALAVAIPGVAALEALTWSHVNVVGTTAWLTLWCAANAWRHDDPRWLLGAGAALGVALHAHPTAIVLAPLLLAQVAGARRVDARRALALGGALLLAAVPFTAGIIASAAQGAGARALADVVFAHAWRHGIDGTTAIVESMLFTIPDLAAGAFLHRGGVPGAVWIAAQRAVWLVTLAGALHVLLREPGTPRRLVAGAIVLTLAAIAFIAALRPYTPFYMVSAAATGLALAAGLALHALASAGRVARSAATLAGALVATMHVALAAGAIERGREGWIRTPLAALSDLKAPPRALRDEALFPAMTRDALGRALCAAPLPVVVHGEFATALDSSFAMEVRLACGRRDLVLLGGIAHSATHWVGLPQHVWRALAITPARWIGSYGMAPPERVIAPALSRAVAGGDAYPPHAFAARADAVLTLHFRAPADRAIVVTNLLPWYLPLDEVTLARDGIAMAPLAASSSVRAWRCVGCDPADAEWTLHLRTADPSWIDVVALR